MPDIFLNYNWDNTELQHRITTRLLEMTDIDAIGATVVGRKPYKYLQQQNDIDYDPLFCVQNVHDDIIRERYSAERIDELEERYGVPFLWPAIWADRKYIDYETEKQKRLLQGWFDFYLDVFETFNPDVFITPSVDSAYTWIPFRIVDEDYGTAVQKGHTRIRDCKAVQKTIHDDFDAIWERYDELRAYDQAASEYPSSHQQAIDFLEEFRTQGVSPGYTDSKSANSSSSSIISDTIEYWWQKNFGYYRDDFYHESTRKRVVVSLKRLVWKRRLDRNGFFKQPNFSGDYVYFPLHLQPEASTMVKAPMYIELPDVIRDISKSLPINYTLYVKEHPALYKYKSRPVDYYKEIDRLPNTELVHPHVNSHTLIRDADAVTTVTGTAGLEGLFYKKPVITFGEPYYDRLTQVSKAGDPKDLCSLVYDAITQYHYTEEHEAELVDLLTAVFEESYPSPMNKSGTALDEAIDSQCAVLKQNTDLGD